MAVAVKFVVPAAHQHRAAVKAVPEDAPPIHESHPRCRHALLRSRSDRPTEATSASLGVARIVLLAVAAAPLGGVLLPEPPLDPGALPLAVRDTAAMLWILCFVPAWHYLRQPARRRKPLPILAIMGIVYAMYYALAPLLALHNVYGDWDTGSMIAPLDPQRDYLLPIRLALGGWIAILIGYAIARTVPLPNVRAAETIGHEFGQRTLARIGFALVAFGFGFEVVRWTEQVPLPLQGTLFFLARITLLGLALLYALRARGVLTPRERQRLTLYTLAVLAVELGTGATYNIILVIFFAFMGSWIGRPRASFTRIVGAIVALALFVSVRGVMIDYRRLTWWGGVEYPLLERSRIMLGLLGDKIDRLGPLGTIGDGIHKVATRSANTDLLADVVRRTPFQVPFWDGHTYTSLVGLAVPRFLWPEKPVKNLGQDFGHRYDYIADADRSTQINLPILIEFYANFGVRGVLLGSLLAGLIYQTAERYFNRPRQSLMVSVAGLSLLQPLLVLELDFSMQLGGLVMTAVALLGLYRILRYFWGGRPRRFRQSITIPRRAPAITASVRVDTRSFA